MNFYDNQEQRREKNAPLIFPKWFLPLDKVDNSAYNEFFRYIEQYITHHTLCLKIEKSHEWDEQFDEDRIKDITKYLSVLSMQKYGVPVKLLANDDYNALWVVTKKLPNSPTIPQINLITAGAFGVSPFKGMFKMGENTGASVMNTAQKQMRKIQNINSKPSTAIRNVNTTVPSSSNELRQRNLDLNKFSRVQRNTNRQQTRNANLLSKKPAPQAAKPAIKPIVPKVHQVKSFDIGAATAYKEFAHSLSGKSIKRLYDAGLFKQNSAAKTFAGMNEKLGAKVLDPSKSSDAQVRLLGKLNPAFYNSADRNIYLNNKGILNKLSLKGMGIKDFDKAKDTLLGHEAAEGLALRQLNMDAIRGKKQPYLDKFGIGKYGNGNVTSFMRANGHFTPKVTVGFERRQFNQRGGTTAANLGLQDGQVYNARTKTGENRAIDAFLPNKDRLRNSDYKKAEKRMSKAYEDLHDKHLSDTQENKGFVNGVKRLFGRGFLMPYSRGVGKKGQDFVVEQAKKYNN